MDEKRGWIRAKKGERENSGVTERLRVGIRAKG